MKFAKRMFSAAKKATVLELFIYDVIGDFWFSSITPQTVADAIKDAGEFSSITVHVNSPGGASFDGVAIHNLIRQQKVPVTVIVEGLAASAAFTVAMAGDTVQVCDGAMMMLHNAWTFASGDAAEMRATANLLDKVSGTLRDLYAKASGMSAGDVATLMDAETWLTGEEAVAKGFADETLSTTPEKSDAAKALIAQFNLAKFCAKVPEKFKATKASGDDGCECPCSECVTGDCEQCSHEGCDCEGCDDCGQQMEAKGPQLVITVPRNFPAADVRRMRSAIAAAARKGEPIIVPQGVTISMLAASAAVPAGSSGEQCKCTCESCVKNECGNCSVANCRDESCGHSAKANAAVKNAAKVDPDGDGDDDSEIVDAIESASQACDDCAAALDTAADKYDQASFDAATSESKKLIAIVEKAVTAMDTESSESDESKAKALASARLALREREQEQHLLELSSSDKVN